MGEGDRTAKVYELIADLQWIVGAELVGTADSASKVRRLDLAARRIGENIAERGPSRDGERGGSSSPVEEEDRQEESKVHRQAVKDLFALDYDVDNLAELTKGLRSVVQRNITSIDHGKLPRTPSVVGCESCARVEWVDGVKRGGHFEPVRDDVKGHRLCDWCYRHALGEANEVGEKVGKSHWLPIDICDIRHRKGPRAAGVELAKRREQEQRRADRKSA